MATPTARKAASARRSPAPRPRQAAAKADTEKRRAKEAAAPLKEAKAASEQPARAKPAEAAKPSRRAASGAEPKKLKLVRDSFTLPKVEYGVIDVLKTRAARLGRPAKKSEIVRAGVKALAEMDDAQFLACVSTLPEARPARNKP